MADIRWKSTTKTGILSSTNPVEGQMRVEHEPVEGIVSDEGQARNSPKKWADLKAV